MTHTAEELSTAIREAITLGLDGESIAGIELLFERFPELADEPHHATR